MLGRIEGLVAARAGQTVELEREPGGDEHGEGARHALGIVERLDHAVVSQLAIDLLKAGGLLGIAHPGQHALAIRLGVKLRAGDSRREMKGHQRLAFIGQARTTLPCEQRSSQLTQPRFVEIDRLPVAILKGEEPIGKGEEVGHLLAERGDVSRHHAKFGAVAAQLHPGDAEVLTGQLERVTDREELGRIGRIQAVLLNDVIEQRAIANAPGLIPTVERRSRPTRRENNVGVAHFVLIMNDVSKKDYEEIVEGVIQRTKHKMPEIPIFAGIGSMVYDIDNLHVAYQRAKAAAIMAKKKKISILHFDDMGIHRLLYSVTDTALLSEMGDMVLKPLLDYDEKHNSNYVETLEWYLKYNGSIQAVAEAMFTHRNTVIYRISNIKKMLQCELDTTEERLIYQMAYFIRFM